LASARPFKVEFSGEECFGKYLDLVPLHDRAANLPACFPPTDYAAYLAAFAKSLAHVPVAAKQSGTSRAGPLKEFCCCCCLCSGKHSEHVFFYK
jgi:hypothetical protein